MNRPLDGILASELIKKLQEAVKEHGDLPVSAGGGDYPEGVQDVIYKRDGDPYVPANSFYLG